MKTRDEWVMGPTLVSTPVKVEWHAGQAKLKRTGTLRFLVGQVRDLELGGNPIHWAMRADPNPDRARIAKWDFEEMYPRASDWMRKTPEAVPMHIPHGWTFAEPGSSFEQGLVI